MLDRLTSIVEGKGGGFQPRPADQRDDAALRAHFEGQTGIPDADESVHDEVAADPAPVRQIPAAEDAAALRADGWTDDDIQALTPEAAARHAIRVSRRPKAERAEEPAGSDDLAAMLTEEFSEKTAKKLSPYLQKQAEQLATLKRDLRVRDAMGLQAQFVGSYPELKSPEVLRVMLAEAGEGATAETFGRVLRAFYGARQSGAERQEARDQTGAQVSSGGRGPQRAPDAEKARRAAFAHFEKTGNMAEALTIRGRLGG